MNAIETVYKGYRFRSRLEARWAVFFDAMGIRWEYEYEGFECNGNRYLPDFYLPDYKVFAEVKGCDSLDQIPFDDIMRIVACVDYDGPCANGVILLGNTIKESDPFEILYSVIWWYGKGVAFGYFDHIPTDLRGSRNNGLMDVIFDNSEDYLLTFALSREGTGLPMNRKLRTATYKMKGSRFEYGECG